MRFLNKEQRDAVGFTYIMDLLDVITPYGREEKKKIKPYKKGERTILEREFYVTEVVSNKLKENSDIFNHLSRQFMKLKDIRNTLKKCQSGECLDEVELFEIKVFSMISQDIKENLELLKMKIDEFELFDLGEVVDLLDPDGRRIPTFHIYEEYSEKLKAIRDEKKRIEQTIYREKCNETISELKEERLGFVVREKEEEWIVREKISETVKKWADKVYINTEKIGKLDLLLCKIGVYVEYGGVKPQISKDSVLKIRGGVNPQVSDIIKDGKGGEFTPLEIELDKGTTVITGANMGGKSVTMKTVVLNVLLMHCGFYTFADEACIPMYDFMYLISDDLQCVSKGLSTFGAEIIQLKRITESAKRGNGLVAFDEFARGTNPYEGGKLVRAVAEYFQNKNSTALFATHYDGVVRDGMIHYQVKGLKDVDFEALKRKIGLQKNKSVDIIQEHMDYGLELVSGKEQVPKDAFNVAMLLGIDKEITTKMEQLYNEEEI